MGHSVGYIGDGFYRSKDPTNSIKVGPTEGKATKENTENQTTKYEIVHAKKTQHL